MPKTFDATALQTKINEYINEISDIITSEKEVEKYTNFCYAIFSVKAMTDFFYTPDKNGNFPEMHESQKLEAMNHYKKAIDSAMPLLDAEDSGPAGERMNTIIKELLPLLHNDYMSLEMADNKKPMTLPEIISRGRTQVVDLGQQPVFEESGNASTRQHIIVENGTEVKEGYFTPTHTFDLQKQYETFLDEMDKKCDPVFKPLIENFRKSTALEMLNNKNISFDANLFSGLNGMSPEEKKSTLESMFYSYHWKASNTSDEAFEEAVENPNFLNFSEEFNNGILKIHNEYENYYGKNSLLSLEDGANIDRRNVAMFRMAGILGKPSLVAETKPMIVIQNGEPIVGTFMAEAYGVDVKKIKANDPVLKYKTDAFNNPEVFDDIAAMQALDFICGNVDRNPGNFFLRFEPKDAENAKLVGITLIDNDMSFGNADENSRGLEHFVKLSQMGVVGEDFYNALNMMTKQQMELMLSDCKLSQAEIDKAWERKEALQKKIEEDKKYFDDKEVGYTEEGRIRLVKKEEWASYSIRKLAQTHPDSKFSVIANFANVAELSLHDAGVKQKTEQQANAIRAEVGMQIKESKADIQIPVGKVIGNGILQKAEEAAPDEEKDITKIAIPSLLKLPSVGNNLSRRYRISYDENGQTKEVFFTPAQDSGVRAAYNQVFSEALEKKPEYEDEWIKLRDYYSTDDLDAIYMPGKFDRIPWKDMGITEERIKQLEKDKKFNDYLSDVSKSVGEISSRNGMLRGFGLNLVEGGRIEARNVMMSDVSKIMGVENVLAKSKMVQVMSEGRVIDGVIMDYADGVDISGLTGNHPMAQIDENKIDDVYNTAEGLKSIADLQMLDYICLNIDRHVGNIIFQFENLGTDNPKFKGVIGIDNDASGGDLVPDPKNNTHHLCSLNSMQIISETMANSVNDDKAVEKMVEMMRKRGQSDAEIEGARKRVEQIKTAIKEERLRVVKDNEWAKGENTLENLSSKQGSYFRNIKVCAIKVACQKGKDYNTKNNGVVKPYVKKKLSFAKCQKVDDFGTEAMANKEFEALERKASKEFLDNIKNAAIAAPVDSALSERELVRKAHEDAVQMLRVFENADPTFSFTSSTYKEVKTACKDLIKFTNKLSKKMRNPEDILSAKDSKKFSTCLNTLADKCAAYKKKKDKELEQGRTQGPHAPARIQACENGAAKLVELANHNNATVISTEAKKGSVYTVSKLLKRAQASLSGLSGQKLKNKVAEIIYYKGLTRMDTETKQTAALKNAIQPKVVKAQCEQIMNSPVFKTVTDITDKELRSLAASRGCENLMKGYIRETAKQMQRNNNKQNLANTKLKNLYNGKKEQKNINPQEPQARMQ